MTALLDQDLACTDGAVIVSSVRSGGPEQLSALAADWRKLVSRGPCWEPFFTPGWFQAQVDAFEPDTAIILIESREGCELRGVLPLVRERSRRYGIPHTRLRSLANAHSCRFDLARGPTDSDGAFLAQPMWAQLEQAGQWDVIEFRDVPQGGAATLIAEVARRSGFPVGHRVTLRSPHIALPTQGSVDERWETLRSGLPSRFRSSLKTWRRRLESHGAIELHRLDHYDPTWFERFYALERASWKGAQGTAIDCDPATRTFYDTVARDAAEDGSLSLYELRAGDQVIAMHYGLTVGTTYYMPKLTYDEDFRQYAPGHLIMEAILRDCLARGLEHFDCLGGADEWKLRWTRDVREHASWFIFGRGPVGRALYALDFPLRGAARTVARGLRDLPSRLRQTRR